MGKGKSSAKPKGGGDPVAIGEIQIGPTGSDPTLSNGTLVNNYDWTKLQLDRYSALLFDSICDVVWGPDGGAALKIDSYEADSDSETIDIDFHPLGTDVVPPMSNQQTYEYSLRRDPRDTDDDAWYGGGGGGGGSRATAKKGCNPEQPAPMCFQDQTTMVKQPDGSWKCPTCGFTIPAGEFNSFMRCVSGRKSGAAAKRSAKVGDPEPVDPCADLMAASNAASDAYLNALASWSAAANAADQLATLLAAKEAALAAFDTAYAAWSACVINSGGGS